MDWIGTVVSAVGFTADAIPAGSVASWMMSIAAVAKDRGVAAGSVVAVLQSVGAPGLSGAATMAVAAVGVAVEGAIARVMSWFP
ncbi:hypothetical protein AOLI_G00015260 [Acnodon oligacanthus]